MQNEFQKWSTFAMVVALKAKWSVGAVFVLARELFLALPRWWCAAPGGLLLDQRMLQRNSHGRAIQ
jgi:hypothetical protein